MGRRADMDKRKAFALLGLLCALLVVSGVFAMSSTNYAIEWDVIGGGGEPISSTSYSMNSTVGQGIIGSKSSTSYQLDSGYWPGVIAVQIGPFRIYLPIILRNFTP
jgi:hypothetical protein